MVVRIGPVLAAEDRTGWPGTWPALSHSETLGEDRLMLCKLVRLPGVAR